MTLKIAVYAISKNEEEFVNRFCDSAKDSAMANIRATRNQLLNACDWTQAVDCTIAKKTEWATYRQALRDLPSGITEPRTFSAYPNNPDYVPMTT